jgi:uncharacterized phage protein (TIGR01671 family)
MNQIKFRAWNKTHNYMQDFNSHKSGILYSWGSFAVSSGYDSLDEPTFEDDTSEEWVIMQFTGLQDNNGVDFYIGNIGEFSNGDRFIVSMQDWLEVSIDWIGEPECEDQARDLYRISNATIIGNIHQNPELIK